LYGGQECEEQTQHRERERERASKKERKGVAFVSLYILREFCGSEIVCRVKRRRRTTRKRTRTRTRTFRLQRKKERKMGNSIAMAEQVLEQEEPVRFLSLSLSLGCFFWCPLQGGGGFD
jgi:hypothetical protein